MPSPSALWISHSSHRRSDDRSRSEHHTFWPILEESSASRPRLRGALGAFPRNFRSHVAQRKPKQHGSWCFLGRVSLELPLAAWGKSCAFPPLAWVAGCAVWPLRLESPLEGPGPAGSSVPVWSALAASTDSYLDWTTLVHSGPKIREVTGTDRVQGRRGSERRREGRGPSSHGQRHMSHQGFRYRIPA